MSRLFSVLLVAFLSLSTGGLPELAFPEPCSAAESAASSADGACPPTCVRCHCTASFELVLHVDAGSAPAASPKWLPPSAAVPAAVASDVLHVPKPALG